MKKFMLLVVIAIAIASCTGTSYQAQLYQVEYTYANGSKSYAFVYAIDEYDAQRMIETEIFDTPSTFSKYSITSANTLNAPFRYTESERW
jgi:hypothetical protein